MDDLIQSIRKAACDTTDEDACYLLREAAYALEAAREDAERYRWLRSLDGACDAAACVQFNIGFDWIEQHGEQLDAAIDIVRAQSPTEEA